METSSLKADLRTAKGTRAAFNFRREGRLPGVIYGEGKPPELILIEKRGFETALRHHARVLDLEMEGRMHKVLIQDVQWSLMGDDVDHVDFLRIAHDAVVEVEVELEFVGHPKGISKGGEFMKPITDLKVRCAPEAIPGTIRILVTELDVNESVCVKDLEIPEGVEALHEPDDVVCTIQVRAVQEEEETEEGTEEESAEPEVITKGKGEEEGSEPSGD